MRVHDSSGGLPAAGEKTLIRPIFIRDGDGAHHESWCENPSIRTNRVINEGCSPSPPNRYDVPMLSPHVTDAVLDVIRQSPTIPESR